MVGRHRRIRLRAEFRTWRRLASRSRARRRRSPRSPSRRHVRVRPRVHLAAFTRVVRDARWVVSADRRADRCARRSTGAARFPARSPRGDWRRATPFASKTNARAAAQSALDAFRARARDATGGVDHTSPRVSRVDESPRRFGSRARVDSYLRRRRERRRRAAEARGENRADFGATLAFRATRLLAEDGADARVSSDEASRRGWRRRSRFERRGSSPSARAVETPGETGAEKITTKTAARETRHPRGSLEEGRRASATVRLALPGDSSDSESENDAGRPCREIRDGGAGKSPRAPLDVDESGGSDSDGIDSLADEVFGAAAPATVARENREPRAEGSRGLRGDGPGRRVRTTTIGCSNGRRVDKNGKHARERIRLLVARIHESSVQIFSRATCLENFFHTTRTYLNISILKSNEYIFCFLIG